MKQTHSLLAFAALAFLLLSSCSYSQPNRNSIPKSPGPTVHLNQVGFLPKSIKQAVVVSQTAKTFSLVNSENQQAVFGGVLSEPLTWPASSESVQRADFSSFSTEGVYRLYVDGKETQGMVTIDSRAFDALASASIKAFYFNRSGTALTTAHAGQWARAAGHSDKTVYIHPSAATEQRPAGTLIESSRGWYDAGDYNKYVVNSGISTYTLLSAYERYPTHFSTSTLNIPESNNAVPDILDEAKWNLDWLLSMQDPNDGGVYHKLTSKNFTGRVMPEDATELRYVVQKSTAATLNFAALMSVASRVYADFDDHDPGFALRCRNAAIAAYQWAVKNPTVYYVQPSDIKTGEYRDDQVTDEFLWANIEISLLENTPIKRETLVEAAPFTIPSWSNVAPLALLSLHHHQDRLPMETRQWVNNTLLSIADSLVTRWRSSAYGLAYGSDLRDFHWGGNSTALNQSIFLIRAYEQTDRHIYLNAATANFDYTLGRNATGYSFVTGFGQNTPFHIHHRVSESDGIDKPIPGFLAGGANLNRSDKCNYPADTPAQTYLDSWCSYTTNEIAINWNAPLVYVSNALQRLHQEGN